MTAVIALLAFVAGAAIGALVMSLRRDSATAPDPTQLQAALEGLRDQLTNFEQQQGEGGADVRARLDAVVQAQGELRQDTSRLSRALTSPGIRGRWGELTLKNVVETCGLSSRVDFDTQVHLRADGEDGAARPDMVVRLPGEGCLPVDAKVSLEHFQAAIDTEDPNIREQELRKHVAAVRAKVKELAAKSYWDRFKRSPECVVMFMPSESAFSEAVERDPLLLSDAAAAKVVITTPSTLVALLQTTALIWRERDVAEGARAIQATATELVKRIRAFGDHLDGVGRSLAKALKAHNSAVGSYESRLLVKARDLDGSGIAGAGELSAPTRVATPARRLAFSDGPDGDNQDDLQHRSAGEERDE
ncbi:MAG: DNA recombination protein RmuC [Solirubrobacterales bacterium]